MSRSRTLPEPNTTGVPAVCASRVDGADGSWLANDKVYLMDLNQDSQEVRDTLLDWAPKYVAQYGIDGFRLDAVKHMPKEWVHDFCEAAGVYCIGEVFNESAG